MDLEKCPATGETLDAMLIKNEEVKDMNQMICSAIQSRQVIRFYYNGGFRTVEPFCYGVSTAGNEVLRAYQTGGYSESGNPVGWKLFRVSEISSLTTTGEKFFGIRPDYNPQDSAMTTIYCHV